MQASLDHPKIYYQDSSSTTTQHFEWYYNFRKENNENRHDSSELYNNEVKSVLENYYSGGSTSASAIQSPFNILLEYDNSTENENSVENKYTFDDPNYELSSQNNYIYQSENMTTLAPDFDIGTNFSIFDQSIWEIFNEKYFRHSLGWTVTLVVAYTLILIIGIIGNLMVILVILKRPQMRTVTNLFIMNLAVADLFVIVFCVPATLISNIFTPWILGWIMCKGAAYVQGVSVCASAYSLAAISLDRCKAIYRAFERPRGLSKRQALFTISFIWMVALLLTIPWAIVFDVVFFKTDETSYCVETWENETHGKIYFLIANLFCCYCLPLILISISNVIIWCHVSKRKVPQDSASFSTIKRMHRRTRHGVRRMLGIVTLTFLLSWLPLYVLVTRVKFTENMSNWESNMLDTLMPLAQLLGSLNSSVNPILYAFLNSKFREMFKSLLPRWVPFIHDRNLKRMTIVNSMARATITNGTCTIGSTGSPSHAPGVFPRCAALKSRKYNEIGFKSQCCKTNQEENICVVSSVQCHSQTKISIVVTEASPTFTRKLDDGDGDVEMWRH